MDHWPLIVAVAALLTTMVAAVLTAVFARSRLLGALDQPNERSLHQTPVPRTGGLALLTALVVGVGLLALAGFPSWHQQLIRQPIQPLLWIAAAIAPLALVSYLDDRGHVSRRLRFAVHLGAAVLLWLGALRWDSIGLPGFDTVTLPASLALVLTLLYTVWMINLYNFMDGMDGFAGGMALFGFGALAVLGWLGGEPAFAACCTLIAAAALGFLTGNFPPARIFLGDAGSATLGLLAAAATLWGSAIGLFGNWVGLLAFSPFIVDASWTLLRRAAQRERLWQAHRSHHYQRLVLAGWGHRRTLLWSYLLMAATAATAVAAPGLPVAEQWLLLGGWACIYALIHVRVGLVEREAARQAGGTAGGAR